MKGWVLILAVPLCGCVVRQQAEPPAAPVSAPVRLAVSQTGYGPSAVFELCAECPGPTRKALAPVPPPLKLPEAPRAPPPRLVEERITRLVHFDLASSVLTKAALEELDNMRPLLLRSRSIVLTGQTDRVGARRFNERLAQARADAVRRAIVGLGVPEERITKTLARCCVEDPPPVNPPARRTELVLLIMWEPHEPQQP